MPKEQPSHKHNVEAVLFSTGRKMTVEEIAKLCKIMKEDALNSLRELQADYNARNSSLMIVDEGDFWKLTVRERHLQVVKKIVAETELPKSIIETLAVIAWKAPVLQSDIIKIRTNKAYEHLKELETSGYITRQKKGRTNLIKITQKFFQYFDLPPEKLQQMFKSINDMEQAIIEKEKQVDQAKIENKSKEEELRRQQEIARKMSEVQVIDDVEVDLIPDKGDKVKLDVYDGENQEETEQKIKKETQEEVKPKVLEQEIEHRETHEQYSREETKADRLEAPEEMVDKRVQELLHPEKEPETDIEEIEEIKEDIEKQRIKESKKKEGRDLLEAEMENKDEEKTEEE